MNRWAGAGLVALTAVVVAAGVGIALAGGSDEQSDGCRHVAIVGDSLVSLEPTTILERFPQAIVNARPGRDTTTGYEPTWGIAASNAVDCWVFALGTNDLWQGISTATSAEAVDALLTLPDGSASVWWVVPVVGPGAPFEVEDWASVIPDDVTLITPSIPDDEYVPDGVHLTTAGYRRRAAQIYDAVDPLDLGS